MSLNDVHFKIDKSILKIVKVFEIISLRSKLFFFLKKSPYKSVKKEGNRLSLVNPSQNH